MADEAVMKYEVVTMKNGRILMFSKGMMGKGIVKLNVVSIMVKLYTFDVKKKQSPTCIELP